MRIALGAPAGNIGQLVLRWAFGLASGGIVLGGLGAVGVTRLLEGLLFGVEATDLATFVVVAVIMAAATLLASLIPALRATRVDPIVAMRAE